MCFLKQRVEVELAAQQVRESIPEYQERLPTWTACRKEGDWQSSRLETAEERDSITDL